MFDIKSLNYFGQGGDMLTIDHYIGVSVIESSFKRGSVTSVHVHAVMLDIMGQLRFPHCGSL